jgi:phosphoribosyl-ATP pyrophosphohydrolase
MPRLPDSAVLDRLYRTIASRRGGDPATSYTAKLFAGGDERIAKKLGEEGVEAALAAASGDTGALVKESADVLYHLLVAWAHADVAPDAVYAELARREGASGIAEKAARTVKTRAAKAGARSARKTKARKTKG